MPAPELLDQPPSRNPFGLGFRPPATPDPEELPPSSQLPSPASSPEETLEDLEAAWDSEGGSPSLDPESLDGTPSTGSSTEGEKVELADEETLRAYTRGGIAVAGQKAHDTFATSEGQRAVGLYLTDEKDQANIGDPLAAIAARHQGIGKVNADTKDLLNALAGLAGYATKQINLRTQARAIDAGAGAGQRIPAEPVDL